MHADYESGPQLLRTIETSVIWREGVVEGALVYTASDGYINLPAKSSPAKSDVKP